MVIRDRGRPVAVPMSVEDFASFAETADLLRNPRDAERPIAAVERMGRGRGAEREISE